MDTCIALSGTTALRVLRAARRGIAGAAAVGSVGPQAPRTPPAKPYPGAARTRWTRGLLGGITLGDRWPVISSWPAYVSVPTRDDRLQLSRVINVVHGPSVGQDAFVTVADGVQIPCPELLFVEMARTMHPYLLCLLGCELCGCYARDPDDPRDGEVAYGLAPVTSVARIRAFIGATARLSGKVAAARAAARACDNAWSPMEAAIAAMAVTPIVELGYGLAPVALNTRVAIGDDLADVASCATRVPDLLLAGSHVGINYDGEDHLDLRRVTDAALHVVADPGIAAANAELDDATRRVRERFVDDRRRDRELWADGYRVFSVTREDLEERGGLDRVMMLVVRAIEGERGDRMDDQRSLLEGGALAKMRQDLIWAALPGRRGAQAIRRLLAREAALAAPAMTVTNATVSFL